MGFLGEDTIWRAGADGDPPPMSRVTRYPGWRVLVELTYNRILKLDGTWKCTAQPGRRFRSLTKSLPKQRILARPQERRTEAHHSHPLPRIQQSRCLTADAQLLHKRKGGSQTETCTFHYVMFIEWPWPLCHFLCDI